MHYKIHYSCLSHIGNVRSVNQDNFICDGRYMDNDGTSIEFPICGTKTSKEVSVFGIFDGMGGEEYGEIASYIASKTASDIEIGKDATEALSKFCQKANLDICDYATLHEIPSMGTTAAMLVFTKKEVALCNIGDSKIFRLCDGKLEQISMDHVTVSVFGVKPPLSQNLGIPPNELVIDPYFARGFYNDGDVYLICSDGLTDMVTNKEISNVLTSTEVLNEANEVLLEKALTNGGRDNITIVLCKIERSSRWLSNLNALFRRERYKNGN